MLMRNAINYRLELKSHLHGQSLTLRVLRLLIVSQMSGSDINQANTAQVILNRARLLIRFVQR